MQRSTAETSLAGKKYSGNVASAYRHPGLATLRRRGRITYNLSTPIIYPLHPGGEPNVSPNLKSNVKSNKLNLKSNQ